MSRPTAPESIRRIVNDFLNLQESIGNNSLMFRLDYSCDEDADEQGLDGEVLLVQFLMSASTEGFTDTSLLRAGNPEYRLGTLQTPCILRISEEGLAPLGVWSWKFINDTLIHLSD